MSGAYIGPDRREMRGGANLVPVAPRVFERLTRAFQIAPTKVVRGRLVFRRNDGGRTQNLRRSAHWPADAARLRRYKARASAQHSPSAPLQTTHLLHNGYL